MEPEIGDLVAYQALVQKSLDLRQYFPKDENEGDVGTTVHPEL